MTISRLRRELDRLRERAAAMDRERAAARTPAVPVWTPFPGPQTQALESPADEVFYGGAAGGGKTDLMLGAALSRHRKVLFLRREAVQLTRAVGRLKAIAGGLGRWSGSGHGGTMRLPGGREIQLSGCEHEDSRDKYQGHDDDLKCFDELPHFLRSQYRFIIGWNRSETPGQRCRVLCGGNPPTTPEGRWVVEEWAPWLDPKHPDPARPGELRWYTYVEDRPVWFRTGDPVEVGGEVVTPRSRTFVPARVQDNPIYMAANYVSVLQAMPEPLRSQMLYGDFAAGAEDHRWQLIPTKWLQAAVARWKATPRPAVPLDCLGVDVAMSERDGGDDTVLAKRYGRWIGPLVAVPGSRTPDGNSVVVLITTHLADGPAAAVNLDAIGIGKSAYDATQAMAVPMRHVRPVVASEGTDWKDPRVPYTMLNVRAAMYWHLRGLLDPEGPADTRLCLPDDPGLLADLAAPRWSVRSGKVVVEPKDDGKGGGIRKRLGRSTDRGDAVALACWEPPAGRVPAFSRTRK